MHSGTRACFAFAMPRDNQNRDARIWTVPPKLIRAAKGLTKL